MVRTFSVFTSMFKVPSTNLLPLMIEAAEPPPAHPVAAPQWKTRADSLGTVYGSLVPRFRQA